MCLDLQALIWGQRKRESFWSVHEFGTKQMPGTAYTEHSYLKQQTNKQMKEYLYDSILNYG